MHFQLRTLLAAMSLSAVVSAGFSVNVMIGTLVALAVFWLSWPEQPGYRHSINDRF